MCNKTTTVYLWILKLYLLNFLSFYIFLKFIYNETVHFHSEKEKHELLYNVGKFVENVYLIDCISHWIAQKSNLQDNFENNYRYNVFYSSSLKAKLYKIPILLI